MANGADYDRCPTDGCQEVEPYFRNGGVDGKQHEYLRWNLFHADRRQGGCGQTWTRTTKQGVAQDYARGVRTQMPTDDAVANRTVSAPSEAYRRNYDLIRWDR